MKKFTFLIITLFFSFTLSAQVEVCGNGIDDNSNGLTDENCTFSQTFPMCYDSTAFASGFEEIYDMCVIANGRYAQVITSTTQSSNKDIKLRIVNSNGAIIRQILVNHANRIENGGIEFDFVNNRICVGISLSYSTTGSNSFPALLYYDTLLTFNGVLSISANGAGQFNDAYRLRKINNNMVLIGDITKSLSPLKVGGMIMQKTAGGSTTAFVFPSSTAGNEPNFFDVVNILPSNDRVYCGNLYMSSTSTTYGAVHRLLGTTNTFVWTKYYNYNGTFHSTCNVIPSNNSAMVTGGSGNSIFLAELNTSGNANWANTYTLPAGVNVEFSHIIPTNDLTGYLVTANLNEAGVSSIYAMKVGLTGNIIWSKRYKNMYEKMIAWNEPLRVSDGYLLFGGSGNEYNNGSASILKIDLNGNSSICIDAAITVTTSPYTLTGTNNPMLPETVTYFALPNMPSANITNGRICNCQQKEVCNNGLDDDGNGLTDENCGINSDINVTFSNVLVSGNVSTNDGVLTAGTTFGTPVALAGNPNATLPVMNSNGSYTFTSSVAGKYNFSVPVCPPGVSTNCPLTWLTITVNHPYQTNNSPIPNTDIAGTLLNTGISINTINNDMAGNPLNTLVLNSVGLSSLPKHGTASVNTSNGAIIYTPVAGYSGLDTLTYQICDNQNPSSCATAVQLITVLPAIAPNTTFASDDYAQTMINIPLYGNVKSNDNDPEGHTQNCTLQTSTSPGKGTFTLTAAGTYTFTPVSGFTGPVEFPYTTCDNGSPIKCATATIHFLVKSIFNTNPDLNATFTNVSVSGNVSTNDEAPLGTLYNAPVALSGNPSPSLPVLNSNGTYTFSTAVPGEYKFSVSVCPPGLSSNCPLSLLKILVVNPYGTLNAPISGTDISGTLLNTAVTINTLDNDFTSNPLNTLKINTVTLTTPPANGTASVNSTNGSITYLPNTNFSGLDSLMYAVCDNQNPLKCVTTLQKITVLPSTSGNTTFASDDFNQTKINNPITGNVKSNDYDAEGDVQNITIQNTTVAGKGTLVLDATGTYTFTPVSGFTGPVEFAYTLCDNNAIQKCANATLHLLVIPVFKTNPDINTTFINVAVTGNVNTNDEVPSNVTYSNPTLQAGNPNASLPVLNANGTYTFTTTLAGEYNFLVSVCPSGVTLNCPTALLTIIVTNPYGSNNTPMLQTDIATTLLNTPVTLHALSNDISGNVLNPLKVSTIILIDMPNNGTASVNTTTGEITYTPSSGFSGLDTLVYRVCDNKVPSLCADAIQVFTILPTSFSNSTSASDDINVTVMNNAISGNVKLNDTDPEGDFQIPAFQVTTVTGKGTLILIGSGSYTFTPVSGFTGPVEFPYSTCDNGTPQKCASATIHLLVKPPFSIQPDFNSALTDITVNGNLNTNDELPSGTIYSSPLAQIGNPTATTPVINSDGTYSFTSSVPGKYNFLIMVCPPNLSSDCPTSLLSITVNQIYGTANIPIANIDIAATLINNPVALNTLLNDGAGNALNQIEINTVTIIDPPNSGTASVNPSTGVITYTPNANFTGKDSLYYRICDNHIPNSCATALQIINVLPSEISNTTSAADDFNQMMMNVTVYGNVKLNDTDPESNIQTVNGQLTSLPGKGTLTLYADGTYTFTPVNDFIGSVDFPYTICDNGSPLKCAKATLHLLVKPIFTTNPDINVTLSNIVVSGNLNTNDEIPVGTMYTNPVAISGNPSSAIPVVSANGSYTFFSAIQGEYNFNISVCPPGYGLLCPTSLLTIYVNQPYVLNNHPIANSDIAVTKFNTSITLSSLKNDVSGNFINRLIPGSVTIPVAPTHGTVLLNLLTGDITYTPNTGFSGLDSIVYQVCDNQNPAACATALQFITVLPSIADNTTSATDDYNHTIKNATVAGNVKLNDSDPEGDLQTVVQQNTTFPGKGTLDLSTDGTYLFTPVPEFTGPVQFTYTICDDHLVQKCVNATLHLLVIPPFTSNPDINATFTGTPVNGNINTNDQVPFGTVYSDPIAQIGNPTADLPLLNPDGTYSFVSTTTGKYNFLISVCPPSLSSGCPSSLLTIHVSHAVGQNNLPLTNTDIAGTLLNTSIVINTLQNDAAGNILNSLVPSSVSITNPPFHGTTGINLSNGSIMYTPTLGYSGLDTFTYQVCDNQNPSACGTALQVITILPSGYSNTTFAADDYNQCIMNKTLNGNVSTNDTDPEGDIQNVTAQNISLPSQGTLTLLSDGSYTFTPDLGFTGPVEFSYTICDNNLLPQCANATLHILVKNYIKSEPDFNSTLINVLVNGNVATNDLVLTGSTYSNPVALAGNPTTDIPVVNNDGTYTFQSSTKGVYYFMIDVCSPGVTVGCQKELLMITVINPKLNNNPPVANMDIAQTFATVPITINTLNNDQCGNFNCTLNPSSVSIIELTKHGTLVVNTANGSIEYTPNAGFSGKDTLIYSICDNSNPSNCANGYQIITVLPSNMANSTTACDDYIATMQNQIISGNLLANDTDPQGDLQTITAQNTTIPNKGVLTLNNTGAFNFVPAEGFSGPVEFPYTVCDNATQSACANGTLHILVTLAPDTDPDFNTAFLNMPITGNVRTNDEVPIATTYGPPIASQQNLPLGILSFNADGTYSFIASNVGRYEYSIPYCVPGTIQPCPSEILIIEVVPTSSAAYTIAGLDQAVTLINQSVIINTLSNDKCSNIPCILNAGSVTILSTPRHGLTTVNTTSGDITYTPDSGFIGRDTLTYAVCQDAPNQTSCDTTYQVITVLAQANSLGLSDDISITSFGTPVSANILLNDTDPSNEILSATAQTTNLSGKGALSLGADGSYTFSPASGFAGTVEFPYEACNNTTSSICGMATLRVMVMQAVSLPIELTFFDATKQKDVVRLVWVTQTEINNNYFTIERSQNGDSFEPISSEIWTKANNGNSDQMLVYKFLDIEPKEGINYYRLKQTDIDGKFSYSKIVTVDMAKNPDVTAIPEGNDIIVFPNPAKESINIGFNTKESDTYKIVLYDITNRVLQTTETETDGRQKIVNLSMQNLPAGSYHISVTNETETKLFRVQKSD